MGLNFFKFSCGTRSLSKEAYSNNVENRINIPHPNDPDPKKYTIKRVYYNRNYVVALIHYPNCINFDGLKILVFDNKEEFEKSNKLNHIDPHFLESNHIIARFKPTKEYFQIAINFVKNL